MSVHCCLSVPFGGGAEPRPLVVSMRFAGASSGGGHTAGTKRVRASGLRRKDWDLVQLLVLFQTAWDQLVMNTSGMLSSQLWGGRAQDWANTSCCCLTGCWMASCDRGGQEGKWVNVGQKRQGSACSPEEVPSPRPSNRSSSFTSQLCCTGKRIPTWVEAVPSA